MTRRSPRVALGPFLRQALQQALAARLAPFGQEHLIAHWDALSDEERQHLAEQIHQLDLTLFAELRDRYAPRPGASREIATDWPALAARAEAPPAVRLDGRGAPLSAAAARWRGEEALRAGQVGLVIVAGGLGTRLGFPHPKCMLPIAPLSGRTLMQVIVDKLLALRRRWDVAIPLYLMTSSVTDEETRAFLAANSNFGLPDEDVVIFQQGSMWAVDDRWERILLEAPARVFLGPDGHGGMLQALAKSGALDDARRRGVTQLFYGQIDNPLLQVCDPQFLGLHLAAGSEATTQVVQKRSPLEKVGNVVSADGRVQIIEYSDLPEEAARRTNADGSLKLWAGNLAVHAFAVDFLERMAADAEALPFHLAHKKVPYCNDRGELVEPREPNAIRLERFIFDLLPHAERALVVEVDPAEAFAPVKNAESEPTDNPRTARQAMLDQHRRWLARAGVEIAPGVPVEIHPAWAQDPAEVAARVSPGMRITAPTYLR
jgi:UDP-N-acetylglucosamine/UDP-N-acetylgalactosamine diphosphorylase